MDAPKCIVSLESTFNIASKYILIQDYRLASNYILGQEYTDASNYISRQ